MMLMPFSAQAQQYHYDVDGNGSVNVTDVMLIVNRILNKPNPGEDEDPNNPFCPDSHHPHAIDLALPSGTKWACCNVDATKPEDFGGYYAWGETSEKDVYDWNSYIHCDGTQYSCHDIKEVICGTEYDVAFVKWGETWQMPSYEQCDELLNGCTYSWTTLNGINGALFTSKTNNKSIFLPAGGDRFDTDIYSRGDTGIYWTGTLHPFKDDSAYSLYFYGDNAFCGYNDYNRNLGRPVRAILLNIEN